MPEYRPIPGYPGYRVSDEGVVETSKYGVQQSDSPNEDGWRPLKPDKDKRGRLRYTLCRDNKPKKFIAAQLVLLAFVGERPPGMVCCHFNDDPSDNRLENLRWDTLQANAADAKRNGRMVRARAKITPDDVRAIRQSTETPQELAKRYGLTTANVHYILNRLTWKDIE